MKEAYRLKVTKIVAIYVFLALLWIATSDYVVDYVLRWPWLHTYKGFAFVLFTGALLFLALHRAAASMRTFETELLASREQFRRVIENAPEAVYIHSDGVFRSANPATLRLFGAKGVEDLEGRPVLDRVHSENREAASSRMQQLYQGRAPVPAMEQRYLRLDGSTVDVEVSAVPFELDGGKGALVFARDISERKRADLQKEELEAQVRQAQKMESIGRLAGGVAHDFNNLLTVINGYSDMLLDGLPESGADWSSVREIRDAGERAAGLTGQLLTFSRKHRANPTVVDVNGMVREVERMLRRVVGEHIVISADLDPETGCVMADLTSMNQMVMNLVMNARDAMPGGGTIVIRTARVQLEESDCGGITGAKPGPFVYLSVSDTGEGIPLEIQSRIFEPFFTTKRESHGTGLGLSTVYGIVQNAGGKLRVESRVGEGTSMQIWLPAHSMELAAANPQELEAALRGSELILLAEDDRAVRQTTETILTRFGYRVLSAESGEGALRLAAEHGDRIDLVLSDVLMPHMTGPQLIRRLREGNPALKALLMSGYRPEELPLLPHRDDDVPCIPKPFHPQALARRIRDVLDSADAQ